MKKRKIRLKNTAKVKKYNQALQNGSRIQHVVRHNGSWAVKRSGASRATGIYDSQGVAINKAVEIAKNYGTSVIIHGKDGRIRDIKRPN